MTALGMFPAVDGLRGVQVTFSRGVPPSTLVGLVALLNPAAVAGLRDIEAPLDNFNSVIRPGLIFLLVGGTPPTPAALELLAAAGPASADLVILVCLAAASCCSRDVQAGMSGISSTRLLITAPDLRIF